MFENLSTRLDGIVRRLRGKGRLTEADVDEMLREIRAALLDADVNVGVTATSSPASASRRSGRPVRRCSIPASRSSRSSTPS